MELMAGLIKIPKSIPIFRFVSRCLRVLKNAPRCPHRHQDSTNSASPGKLKIHYHREATILHECPMGAMRKCSVISMRPSVVSGLRRTPAPRLCLKNVAAARRISVMARWIPIHTRVPAPNGMYAAFCSGVIGCLTKRQPSNLESRGLDQQIPNAGAKDGQRKI